jgi:tetratricopeptide (TPR) repeat protein
MSIQEDRRRLAVNAEKLLKQGKKEAALREYEKALHLKQDDPALRKTIGDLYIQVHDTPNAIKHYNWIVDHYVNEGFFTRAMAMLKLIDRLAPQNEAVLLKLAELYTRQGLNVDARQIYFDLAETCNRQGNHRQALGMYKRVLEFDQRNIKLRQLLADLYLREQMTDEAVGEYVAASDILLKERQYKQACDMLLEHYKKLKHPVLFAKLASCYMADGNTATALQMLKGLGAEIDSHPALQRLLAELYLGQDQVPEAERILQRIVNPGPAEVETIIKLGEKLLQQRQVDRAFNLFQPLVERYSAASRHDEAIALLHMIMTADTQYWPALARLAALFKATGKTNNLIALYETMVPVCIEQGRTADGIAILQELTDLVPERLTYRQQLDMLRGVAPTQESAIDLEIEDDVREKTDEFAAPAITLAADKPAPPATGDRELARQPTQPEFPAIDMDDFQVEGFDIQESQEPIDLGPLTASPADADADGPIMLDDDPPPARPQPAPVPRTPPPAAKAPTRRVATSAQDVDDLMSSLESILLADKPTRVAPQAPAQSFDDDALSGFDEDDLIGGGFFMPAEEPYYESESVSAGELDAIHAWVEQINTQRSATIEKSMSEIFQAFRKGIDEKIGTADVDTRYNLGIAYKEMGLIDEAIHEFFISAQNAGKFFESAGLLGVCFREKIMLDESLSWLERALQQEGRKPEEYTAVKYELLLTAMQKEDYLYARKLAMEVLQADPEHRDIQELSRAIVAKF